MDNLTVDLDQKSINFIRSQIKYKTSDNPYFANIDSVANVVTDMDHQPYTRWFRGVYYYPEPVIMEREAGWRPIHNNCYNLEQPPIQDSLPNHCFEAPCSTTFPCYPKYLTKYADKESLDIMINKACTLQYR
jgi:hypothetical protein